MADKKTEIQSPAVSDTQAAAAQFSRTSLIVEAGTKLRMSEEAIASAAVFFHTFNSVMERDHYDKELVVMAALNLAAKTQEDSAKLSDVVNTCYRCFHRNSPPLEVKDLYWQLKDSVVRYELLLLRALRFKLNLQLPHRYLLHYLLALSKWVDERVWQKSHVTTVAWAILQDSYHTTLCLKHSPSLLATAVVYLALNCCKLDIPGQKSSGEREGGGREGGEEGGRKRDWWEVCDPESSEEQLQEIASEIMAVYDMRKQTEKS